jgi:hypothetical protein
MAISERPWGDITPADYSDAEHFCRSALINLNDGEPSAWTKANCKLPVFEPNGDLNRAAVHAAAAVLAGARGGVDAPASAKRAAARRLLRLYDELGEQAPPSIRALARS